MMKLVYFRVPLLAVLLLASSGCVELRQKLVWHADNSGEIMLDYRIPVALWDSIVKAQVQVQHWQGEELPAKPGAADLIWWYNERQVREFCRAAGGKVISYERQQTPQFNQVKIHCQVDDMPAVLAGGSFGTFGLEHGPTGLTSLRASLAGADSKPAPLRAERQRELVALCQDLRLQLDIVVPGTIETSTATTTAPHHATWVFDAKADPQFLTTLPVVELAFRRADAAAADRGR